jgi:hypothetical protein
MERAKLDMAVIRHHGHPDGSRLEVDRSNCGASPTDLSTLLGGSVCGGEIVIVANGEQIPHAGVKGV